MAVRYLNATGTQALINEIKNRLALKANQSSIENINQRLTTISASIPTKTSDLENDAEFLTPTAASQLYYDKTNGENLSIAVQNMSADIATLEADSDTEGSVDYKIAQALEGGAGVQTIVADGDFADLRAKLSDVKGDFAIVQIPTTLTLSVREYPNIYEISLQSTVALAMRYANVFWYMLSPGYPSSYIEISVISSYAGLYPIVTSITSDEVKELF